MRKLLFLLFLFVSACCSAQLSDSYKDLKEFVKKQPGFPIDSTPFLSIYYNKQLHYLSGFYKAFQQEDRLTKNMGSKAYYDDLSQLLSFAGDYSSVLAAEKNTFDPLPDSLSDIEKEQATLAKNAFYTDAKTYILNKARSNKVVMINEAHNKPLHRAFTASLLEGLYQQGFRYLAMEALSGLPNASLRKLNILTGHYTCEPVAGELVRKALELGFTLIPYEDAEYGHTPNQRAYLQAKHIYDVLKKDSSAKMIVHAGYGNIEEGARSDSTIPMAAYFKIISGIDPLTIDQTEMTENSTTSFGSWLYNLWMQKHPATAITVPLVDNRSIDPLGLNLYDIYVIHPPTKYSNNRPLWMTMDGWKKEIPVQPAFQFSFLVQAYYDNEYTEKKADESVPADQTYNSANDGYYYLYLHKGKYQLVFRDKYYKVLGTKAIVVQ